jgi:hypothetical protein
VVRPGETAHATSAQLDRTYVIADTMTRVFHFEVLDRRSCGA